MMNYHRALHPGARPVAAGSLVTAPAPQNKHICRNVAERVFMGGRHDWELNDAKEVCSYLAQSSAHRKYPAWSTSTQILRTK